MRRKRIEAESLLARTALTSVLAMGLLPMENAVAQEQSEAAQPTEEIVVTGSRIARDPNTIAPVPVQSVGGEELQLSGDVDIVETLNDVPALLTSSSSTNSVSGIFSESVGANTLQLRGLGAERTLVLVDGRRHVSGIAGSQTVDVGSIPRQLIERVEVLTGGASAVYGADAVTGVVNFILKDDFEGLHYDVSAGISEQGDSENFRVSTIYGKNFASDRGNFTLSLDYQNRDGLRAGERAFSRNNGIADDQPNPALRFQQGDINSSTPNFQQFYALTTSFADDQPPCNLFGINFCAGLFDRGLPIQSQEAFLRQWRLAFPGQADPTFTSEELALFDRGANSPSRLIARDPRFAISSAGGLILPGSVFDPGIDLDNDGVSDCQQSFVGFNAPFDFSPAGFGFAGGCWAIGEDGTVAPYQDGQITGVFNQFGGDGIPNTFDEDLLIPEDESISVNFSGHYDLTDNVRFFTELKYVHQETEFGGPLNTFYDLLTIAPDNPFIDQLPQELADVARAEGLFVTRDPADLGPNINKNTRNTYRIVAGFEGEFENGWTYEFSANYGKFEQKNEDRNRVIVDRWFAAIDAVTDPNTGEIICRSDIDPTAPPTTPFNIPLFEPGFFTFNPGDGSCAPADILGGRGGISQEAIDFITTTTVNNFELEQAVFSAVVAGDTSDYLEAPGGPIGFAIGAELRTERSRSEFDPLVRGELPVDGPNGNAGDLLTEVFDGQEAQNSLVFDPGSLIRNVAGSYDVVDLFAEVSVPLLEGAFLAEELSIDAAFRYSDYSTVGSTLTWKAGGSWTPVEDIRFRGTYSVAVRAPNIDELFSPAQGAFFRPIDPCDQSEIDALIAAGDARGPVRAANCAADGIPVGFSDPLSARFVGEIAGNPDLEEETAKTFTVGTVIQPRWVPGFSLTVDYWSIRITNAITSPAAQDVVDSCYDSASFPDSPFCALFRRNDDATSPQFQGFNFLRLQELNIAALETAGIDFAARYNFDVADFNFDLGVSGTRVRKLDEFFDPSDLNLVDPELGELQRPKWAGNVTGAVSYGPVRLNWQTQYLGKQALRSVEIETVDQIFGPAGIQGNTFIHDISFTYDVHDNVRIYGGVNNVADKQPFITEQAFPVSGIGRSFFLGVSGQF